MMMFHSECHVDQHHLFHCVFYFYSCTHAMRKTDEKKEECNVVDSTVQDIWFANGTIFIPKMMNLVFLSN